MSGFTRAELIDLTRKSVYHSDQLSDDETLAVDYFTIGNVLSSRRALACQMREDPGNSRYAMLDLYLDFFLEHHPRIVQYQDLQ